MGGRQPSKQRKAEQEAHRRKGEPCGGGQVDSTPEDAGLKQTRGEGGSPVGCRGGRSEQTARVQGPGTEGWPGKGRRSTQGTGH